MQHVSRRFSGFAYLYVAVASIITTALYTVYTYILQLQLPPNPPISYTLIKLVSVFIIFLPPLIMVAVCKYPVAHVLRLNAFRAKYAWYAIGIGVCLFLFIHLFSRLISSLIDFAVYQMESGYFYSSYHSLWPYVLTSCLIPAFFETAVFQGIIQSGFHDVKPLKACLLVGLLYWLWMAGSSAAFGGTAMFTYVAYGFVLSYIAVQSGSILPAMITSFTYYVFSYGDFEDMLYQYVLSPLGLGENAAAIILLVLALAVGGLLIVKMPLAKEASKPLRLRLSAFKEYRQRLTMPYIPAPKESVPEAVAEDAPEPAALEPVEPEAVTLVSNAVVIPGDTAKKQNIGFIVGGALLAALSLAALVYGIVNAIRYSNFMD